MPKSNHNYNKLLNVSAAAIVDNNKILLIKRVKPPFANLWAIPGGKIEFGEHPEQAVLREIKEETNLDCKFEGLKGIASEIVHNSGKKVAHNMLYICKLKPLHTNIQMKKEGEVKWFDINELDNIKMVPSDLLMFKEFVLKDKKVSLHKIKMIEDEDRYYVEEFGE